MTNDRLVQFGGFRELGSPFVNHRHEELALHLGAFIILGTNATGHLLRA